MTSTGRFKAFASFVGKASSFRAFFDKRWPNGTAAAQKNATEAGIMSLIGEIKASYPEAPQTEDATMSLSSNEFTPASPFVAASAVAAEDPPARRFAQLSSDTSDTVASTETAVLELPQQTTAALSDDEDVLELS